MFIGHFALGFGTKKYEKKISLGTLFMAAQFLDLLWPFFLILGWETAEIDPGNTAVTPLNFTSYPYSHSLFFAIIWGLVFGSIYYFMKGNGRGAFVLGFLVVSHWILDFITHRPDLPLTPWLDTKVGLGLWNSVAGTVVVEVLLFGIMVFIFLKAFKFRDLKGKLEIAALILFLVVIYFSNILGPPPPSIKLIGYVGLSQWLLVAWGYYIDNKLVKSQLIM